MFDFASRAALRIKRVIAVTLIHFLFIGQPVQAQDIVECPPSEHQINTTIAKTPQSQVVKVVKRGKLKAPSNSINKRTRKPTSAKYTRPIVEQKTLPVAPVYPATVISVKGDAWRGGQRLTVGMQLQFKDIIQTNANSFVSIRLGDGVSSTLPSNSKIELSMGQPNVARLKLLNGRVESHVPKAVSPTRNTFEIQLPRSVLGVRGTHFLAESTQNDKQQLQVLEGIVVIQSLESCNMPVVVNAGQGALIESGQETVKPLLAAPHWLASAQVQDQERMTFLLEPVDGAEYYQAQIATDPEFLNIKSETYSDCPRCAKIKMGHVASQIPNGQYYVRFMALDKDNITGAVSQYAFVRQRPE